MACDSCARSGLVISTWTHRWPGAKGEGVYYNEYVGRVSRVLAREMRFRSKDGRSASTTCSRPSPRPTEARFT